MAYGYALDKHSWKNIEDQIFTPKFVPSDTLSAHFVDELRKVTGTVFYVPGLSTIIEARSKDNHDYYTFLESLYTSRILQESVYGSYFPEQVESDLALMVNNSILPVTDPISGKWDALTIANRFYALKMEYALTSRMRSDYTKKHLANSSISLKRKQQIDFRIHFKNPLSNLSESR